MALCNQSGPVSAMASSASLPEMISMSSVIQYFARELLGYGLLAMYIPSLNDPVGIAHLSLSFPLLAAATIWTLSKSH